MGVGKVIRLMTRRKTDKEIGNIITEIRENTGVLMEADKENSVEHARISAQIKEMRRDNIKTEATVEKHERAIYGNTGDGGVITSINLLESSVGQISTNLSALKKESKKDINMVKVINVLIAVGIIFTFLELAFDIIK